MQPRKTVPKKGACKTLIETSTLVASGGGVLYSGPSLAHRLEGSGCPESPSDHPGPVQVVECQKGGKVARFDCGTQKPERSSVLWDISLKVWRAKLIPDQGPSRRLNQSSPPWCNQILQSSYCRRVWHRSGGMWSMDGAEVGWWTGRGAAIVPTVFIEVGMLEKIKNTLRK